MQRETSERRILPQLFVHTRPLWTKQKVRRGRWLMQLETSDSWQPLHLHLFLLDAGRMGMGVCDPQIPPQPRKFQNLYILVLQHDILRAFLDHLTAASKISGKGPTFGLLE
eukprot:scaffold17274_cov124-Skeletonema_marinoi.AAC.2